jgi:hypothetical protein
MIALDVILNSLNVKHQTKSLVHRVTRSTIEECYHLNDS